MVLLERSEIGTEASGRNAGSLHGQIAHEAFSELGEPWARAFLPALEFLLESLSAWRTLSDELQTDLEVTTHGGLLLVDDPIQMRLVEQKVRIEQLVGLDSRLLSRDELLSIAPYVSRAMIGAEFSPVEGKVNPMLAAPAFARAALEAGAEIRARTGVITLEARSHEVRLTIAGGVVCADQVVLASGNELADHARNLGTTLPITTEPVQVSVTEPIEPLINHLVYFAGQRLTLKQASAGSVLIGGGWPARVHPLTGYPTVDVTSLRENLSVAVRAAPRVGSALLLRSWAGIGNGTPDHRPLLGRLESAPRALVGLFPYMGLTAGPLMGRVLADIALGNKPGLDISPFKPGRFSGPPGMNVG